MIIIINKIYIIAELIKHIYLSTVASSYIGTSTVQWLMSGATRTREAVSGSNNKFTSSWKSPSTSATAGTKRKSDLDLVY